MSEVLKEEDIPNNALTYCDLGIAYECNMKCRMCSFWLDSPLNKDNVLSIENWMNILKQISKFTESHECMINFSGTGESLLRKDIFKLIEYGRSLNLKIQIISNGLCVSEEMAKNIHNSGREHICFSLDSLNPKTHDFMRGKDQAHKAVMNAIDNIAAFSPETIIGINTIISGVNLDEIVELVEWVYQNENIAYINFQAIAQPFSYNQAPDEEWFKREENSLLWPGDKQKIEMTMNRLIELKRRGYKIANDVTQLNAFRRYFLDPLTFIKQNRCNLGQAKVLNIDPAGNIARCQLVGIIDNIKNGKSLKEICASNEACEHLDKINKCRRNCHLVVSCYYHGE
ncbi:MAG: radical SAM protein [Candidatus Omnitrophica bacterium]|nr:radical SAM protein [Candidatus Omnitrophota bacterium]